ncbi:MAG: exo-alpha-sialidase [Bryobacterales bacterium]|nr:exo-alpha-sialidase [Acidobacteriota bacterium]MCB9383249.1 exo-alpha-sialidase [Bryobacterales bacterium]
MRFPAFVLAMALVSAPGAFAQEAFSVELAPPGEGNPRNTEGDVAVLRDGRLLAVWSAFRGGSRDDSTATIVAARSSDGGRTWERPWTLQENTGAQNVMSASLLRSKTSGDLLLFFGKKNSTTDLHFWVRRSSDDGVSWSEATIVNADPGYYVMNNARVVQLRSGRLLVPMAWSPEVFAPGTAFKTAVYFSDDDGRTWKRSSPDLEAPKRGAMEPGVVELSGGKVLQIIRTQTGKIWRSVSSDGGETWSKAEPWTMTSPESPATIVRLADGRLALFRNPDVSEGEGHLGPRTPLVVATSRDDGRTWSEPKRLEHEEGASFAYLSATQFGERLLLTYWVGHDRQYGLRFRSLPLSFLD